uniref:Protein kinase domain-containing protein n=1 Tax=Arcella intermedia TaxID=1963864 RepID=A0A6B2L0K0_9EUKA
MQAYHYLEVLNLNVNLLSDKGCAEISLMLKTDSTIKVLGLAENSIGDITALCDSLLINTTLTDLNLSGNLLKDASIQNLAQILLTNTVLKYLDLSSTGITGTGAVSLCESLEKNPTMVSLSIASNKIGLEGSVKLANTLKYNTSLQDIILIKCDIPSQGILELASLLPLNSTLQTLHLDGNNISDTETKSLCKACKSNSSLVSLSLKDNPIRINGRNDISDLLKTKKHLCIDVTQFCEPEAVSQSDQISSSDEASFHTLPTNDSTQMDSEQEMNPPLSPPLLDPPSPELNTVDLPEDPKSPTTSEALATGITNLLTQSELIETEGLKRVSRGYKNNYLNKNCEFIIGRHGNFECLLAEWDGLLVEMYSLPKTEEGIKEQDRTWNIVKDLRHPRIVQSLVSDISLHSCFILTDLLEIKLSDLISLKDSRSQWSHYGRQFAKDILLGLIYLHHLNLVHGGVSSSTCLIDGYNAKLSVVGYITPQQSIPYHNYSQDSYAWLPPEQINLTPIDDKADIYSFGIAMWVLYNQAHPWEQASIRVEDVLEGFMVRNPFVVKKKGSKCEILEKLISICTATDPTQRPSSQHCLHVFKDL